MLFPWIGVFCFEHTQCVLYGNLFSRVQNSIHFVKVAPQLVRMCSSSSRFAVTGDNLAGAS